MRRGQEGLLEAKVKKELGQDHAHKTAVCEELQKIIWGLEKLLIWEEEEDLTFLMNYEIMKYILFHKW